MFSVYCSVKDEEEITKREKTECLPPPMRPQEVEGERKQQILHTTSNKV